MKVYTVTSTLYATLVAAANLTARQDRCPNDNCFNNVWGTAGGTDHLLTAQRDCSSYLITTVIKYPVTTVDSRNTVTTTIPCLPAPTSSVASTMQSLPGFTFPSSVPTPIAGLIEKLRARQNECLSSSTTEITGSIPAYAGVNCPTISAVFSSICSCKDLMITQKTITLESTTITNVLRPTVTVTALCSTALTVTLSNSAFTTVTVITLSSPAGTGTGTGTDTGLSQFPTSATVSSNLPSPDFTTVDAITTSYSSLSSSPTIANTSLTSSSTSSSPTPSCVTPGWIFCNGTCLNPTSDERNCGSCGNSCSDGLTCFNGVCARRPADPPCDTNCTYRRECNQGLGRASCSCARDPDGYGICFDANIYQCLDSTPKCKQTTGAPGRAGCKLGEFCIKSICRGSLSCGAMNVTEADQDGVCVANLGCGRQGLTDLGKMLRIGEQQVRKRATGGFNW